MVELIRITKRGDHARVDFQVNGGERLIMVVGTEPLQDFYEFQRYAFMLNGLWVRHPCEGASSDREAAKIWSDSIEEAVEVGRES